MIDKFKSTAQDLRERILRFEEYLGMRVQHMSTTLDCGSFRLIYARRGQEWKLFVEDKLLEECSLKLKVEAMSHFPDLIPAMIAEREAFIKIMESAVLEFDAFYGSLK